MMGSKRNETTLYVIAYDITNDRRWTKMHKLLSGYGQWTQYSLFEAFLTQKELIALRSKLDKLLSVDEDSVRFYTLCAGCVGKVHTVGSAPPKEAQAYIV